MLVGGSCDHKLLRNLRMFKIDMGCVVGPLSFIRTYSVRFIAAFTFFLSSLPVKMVEKDFRNVSVYVSFLL